MKTLLWIVIAAVVIGGGWFAVTHFSGGGQNAQPSTKNASGSTGYSTVDCSKMTQAQFTNALNRIQAVKSGVSDPTFTEDVATANNCARQFIIK